MAINFYGMPVQPSSVGLDTLFNYIQDPNNSGGELILLDPDMCTTIYSLADVHSDQYKQMADRAENEFKIKSPDPQKLASLGDFLVNCVVAGFEALVQFGLDTLAFAAELAGKTVGSVAKGLSSGLSDIFNFESMLLIGGAVALAFVILR